MRNDRLAKLFCIAASAYQLGVSTSHFEKNYFNSDSKIGSYWEFLTEVYRATVYDQKKQEQVAELLFGKDSEEIIH